MPRSSKLWNYFAVVDESARKAECNYCKKCLSFKTTISNLKNHLKQKHLIIFEEMCRNNTRNEIENDDDAEESLRLTDIWNFYEEEAGKARCVVCRASMGTDYEELKAHLKDSHPKLLLQLLQDKDDSDAGSNNGGDDNTYTEIVYLEQEAEEIKPKEKSKYIPRTTPILTRKRERLSVAEEIPVKQKKTDDNDELSIFIKYITCLLKKLPPDAFSQVQIEIINTILKASANANTSAVESPRVILNNELPVTSGTNLLTLNEVQPGNSAQSAHNYTITVATKDGGEIENS